MDKITLAGMAFYGYHGVYPEENKLGQRYILDVELYMPLHEAGETDELDRTVNYAEAYAVIKRIVEGEPLKLIEALAERVAKELFRTYTIIHELTVRVTKPNPPFDVHFQGVTVHIHRKRPAEIAYIGLGSNMEQREQFLQQALAALEAREGIELAAVSSIYETDPVGFLEQPPFLNMAAAVRTTLTPKQLLAAMLDIERSLGRIRTVRWGPRTIDLDLLLYGEANVTETDLTVPHPRMGERAFVLVPLLEVMDRIASPHPLKESYARQLETLEGKEGIVLWKEAASRSASERSAN
jgi:2-amino-4-hydroxy-6-hydroxymethyldihydropteridine diphosphokinase/dihydroneopterin aldolase